MTPQLWVWMCSPGWIGSVAKPMIWPNFLIGSPTAIAAVAILWPLGTRESAVTPSAVAPGRIGSMATTRLSAGCRRRTRGFLARSDRPSAGAAVVSVGLMATVFRRSVTK